MRRCASLTLLLSACSAAVTASAATTNATLAPGLNLTLSPALPADFNASESLLLTTSPPPAIASPTTSLEWARCGFTAVAGSGVDRDYFDCADLAVPVCYADMAPCSKGTTRTHTLRALRRPTNATDAPTVWIISESVDDAKTAAIMEHVRDGRTINMYAVQSRLWNPPTSKDDSRSPCGQLAVDVGARVDIDSTTIDAALACQAWLTGIFGSNATNAFSLDTAARDLAAALQIVQTQDLKTKSAKVYVLAMGQASRVVQRFMATSFSKDVSVAGYIFDTPHAMKLSPSYDETVGASMGRFLDGCNSHVQCSTKFANLSISMRDVLAKLEAAADLPAEQTSQCVAMLKNAAFKEDRDLKPSHGVRRYFAELRRSIVGYKIAAPLLYRLQRCNSSDHYGVEKLLGAVWTQPSWSSREALAEFVERVIAYSEFWPSPAPSRDALVDSFEKSLVSDGAMVAQEPSYCLYTASDAPECMELYRRNPQVNATLRLTYLVQPSSRSVNTATGLVGSASAAVLILASRLSLAGSASVANDLYDAFISETKNAILIETDSVLSTSELEGSTLDSQVLLQVVGAFVAGETAQLHGKWRVKDLSPPNTDWSKAKSTYASSPQVALTFTLTQEEQSTSALLNENDLYEFIKWEPYRRSYKPSTLSDDGGIQYGYYALLFGGILLMAVFMVWARAKRVNAEVAEFQRQNHPAPPPPSMHVNVVIPPPQTAQQIPSYGMAPPPHAIPMPQQQPPNPYPTAYPTHTANVQPPPTLARATQWRSEPVNEYAYSYTPVTDRPMRTGL